MKQEGGKVKKGKDILTPQKGRRGGLERGEGGKALKTPPVKGRKKSWGKKEQEDVYFPGFEIHEKKGETGEEGGG